LSTREAESRRLYRMRDGWLSTRRKVPTVLRTGAVLGAANRGGIA